MDGVLLLDRDELDVDALDGLDVHDALDAQHDHWARMHCLLIALPPPPPSRPQSTHPWPTHLGTPPGPPTQLWPLASPWPPHLGTPHIQARSLD